MDENEKDYLKKFYGLLRDNLRREKGLKGNSVLMSFLETRSAVRYRLLSNSTLPSVMIPHETFLSLLSKNYIQVLGGISDYAITAKGVWHYEKDTDVVNEETLMSYINDKFFIEDSSGAEIKNDLDEKEKVILFAMISARAFSESSSADLKRSDTVKDKWQEVLEKAYDLLCNLHLVAKLKKEDFFGKMGNEHIASSIFRHNNHMVQKTRGIYSYTGKYEYYLNLYGNSTFSSEKLSYLFWKIFKGDISIDSVDLVNDFCNKMSSRESIYLFDMEKHVFSMPTFDDLLKDSLLDSIVSKAKWQRVS